MSTPSVSGGGAFEEQDACGDGEQDEDEAEDDHALRG